MRGLKIGINARKCKGLYGKANAYPENLKLLFHQTLFQHLDIERGRRSQIKNMQFQCKKRLNLFPGEPFKCS